MSARVVPWSEVWERHVACSQWTKGQPRLPQEYQFVVTSRVQDCISRADVCDPSDAVCRTSHAMTYCEVQRRTTCSELNGLLNPTIEFCASSSTLCECFHHTRPLFTLFPYSRRPFNEVSQWAPARQTPKLNTDSMSDLGVEQQEVFRLLDLPAELRNRIYEFALYHSKNAGHIAPTFLSAGAHHVVIQGRHRYVCLLGTVKDVEYPELYNVNVWSHLQAGGTTDDQILQRVSPGSSSDQAQGTGVYFCAHVCSLKCLMQPALTKTNRQIRDETLPIFYSCNSFQLELPDSFDITNKRAGFVYWWRSTGDTNLRSINHLVIAVNSREKIGEHAFSFDRTKHERTLIVTRSGDSKTIEEMSRAPPSGDSWQMTAHPAYLEYGAQIKEEGLFVRGMERMVAWFPQVLRLLNDVIRTDLRRKREANIDRAQEYQSRSRSDEPQQAMQWSVQGWV